MLPLVTEFSLSLPEFSFSLPEFFRFLKILGGCDTPTPPSSDAPAFNNLSVFSICNSITVFCFFRLISSAESFCHFQVVGRANPKELLQN